MARSKNPVKKFFPGIFSLLILSASLLTASYFLPRLTGKDTNIFSHAASPVIFSDDFSTLSNWTVTGAKVSSGQTATPNIIYNGKKSVKLVKNSSDAICLSKPLTPASDIRVKVSFYDDYGASAKISGSFISLRNTSIETLPQVTIGVRTGKYKGTINNQPVDFYFLRIGNNSYPVGSGLDPDSSSFIRRTPGWHTFEIVHTPYGTYAKIDGISLSYLPGINGVSKGFTKRIGMANQLTICNTWTNGEGYYSNLEISSPAVSAYPGAQTAIYNHINNYLTSYQPFTKSQITQIRDKTNSSGGWTKDWYTVSGVCRINADDAAASAVIWKKTGNQSYRDRAIASHDLVADDICYSSWKAGKEPYNTVTFPFIFSSWLLWNDLNPDQKNLSASIIGNELNFFANFNPANRWQGDSAAEENSWIAQDLWLGSVFLKNHPNSKLWQQKADLYAFHSLTLNESFGGQTTQTLEPGFFIQNHNTRNMTYQSLSVGQLGIVKLLSDQIGQPVSSSVWMNNVKNVWQAVEPTLDSGTLLAYMDNPKGTWPLAANRGNKDEQGLDPFYILNTLYFAQKNSLGKTGYPWFDKILEQAWYLYNDFSAMPIGGAYCADYASTPSCIWRYSEEIDPDIKTKWGIDVKLNEFRKQVYNSVLAGERLAVTAVFMDNILPRFSNSAQDTNIDNLKGFPSAVSGTSPLIIDFINTTGITNYKSIHFSPKTSLDIYYWPWSVLSNQKYRVYFYDNTLLPKGFNFGIQSQDKLQGLTLQVRSQNSSVSNCSVISEKSVVNHQCYVVRVGSQGSGNEKNTYVPRTTGWHFVDFYKSPGKFIMSIDGISDFEISDSLNINTTFISSSNWNIPTESDYVITNVSF